MKKVLITGAGSGLGLELAKCYAKEKNHVILVGRNKEKLEKAVDEITKSGESAEYFICDISNIESVKELVEYICIKHKTIDYLINNAGIGIFNPISELTVNEINKMIDINVKGTIMVTQRILPYINERILNIISTAGLKGKVNESVYCASKFAIRGFTESLQKEFIDEKIKITAVYMGGMNTPFWEGSKHIKDKNRLKSATEIAKEIIMKDDGRLEIIIGQ
ncbi:Short-chain dehydrogenase [Clostridium cavendishii DSM 21758]|uniref:Short-chain dehydrogenase n=1 Tax=Clostridium cavendishii DSM 21758 TaxID=1121302 RepID=A0A1M6BE28_9CLOT|nr:SDR family oxidoreductase [Clostridium cavendishii]SHI46965.1 Short-chain dehydrogenase [Clostridium cavendishii DSM 21758]